MAIAGTREADCEEMMPNGILAKEKGEFFGMGNQEAMMMLMVAVIHNYLNRKKCKEEMSDPEKKTPVQKASGGRLKHVSPRAPKQSAPEATRNWSRPSRPTPRPSGPDWLSHCGTAERDNRGCSTQKHHR